MKLAILSTAIYPSKMANRIHLLKTAEAFAMNGVEVTLLGKSIHLNKSTKFQVVNFEHVKRAASLAYQYIKWMRENDYTQIYIREPRLSLWVIIICLALRLRTIEIVYEVHDMPRDFFDRILTKYFLARVKSIIAITHNLKRDLALINPKLKEKIKVLPDGVDLEMFKAPLSKVTARRELGLAEDGKYVVYTGHLYAWKGVYTLCDAAIETPEITYLLVGGKPEDVSKLKRKFGTVPNIHLLGYQPHESIPNYLYAADILVLPNSSTNKMSDQYTSPLKLFEYMAANRPIVASKLSSICEIISDGINGYLVTPDNANAIAQKFNYIFTHYNESLILAQKAADEAQSNSWLIRCAKILKYSISTDSNQYEKVA